MTQATLRERVCDWVPALLQYINLDRLADLVLAPFCAQEAARKLFRDDSQRPTWSNAALLDPKAAVVDFHHRDRERADLHTWCLDAGGPSLAWRVLTGDAGRGKTRLAMQVVAELRQERAQGGRAITAGFLDLNKVVDAPETLLCFHEIPGDLVFVVDYAETHRETLAQTLLASLSLARGDDRRRVM